MTLQESKNMFLPYLHQLKSLLDNGRKGKYIASYGETEIDLTLYERAIIEREIIQITNVCDVLINTHQYETTELIIEGKHGEVSRWDNSRDFAAYYGLTDYQLYSKTQYNKQKQMVWKI